MTSIIWIDANAGSGGNGSSDRPFSSIQDALDSAKAGSTLMVRAGTYEENIDFSFGGAPGSPITLKSADGPGAAIIKPADQSEDTIRIDGHDHIVIDGFQLYGSSDDTRQVIHIHAVKNKTDPASDVAIINNTIHRGEGDAVKISKSTDIVIANNKIVGGGDGESAIDLVGAARVVIDQNDIRDIPGIAIMIKGGSENVNVTGNAIANTGANAIEVGGYSNLRAYPLDFLESGKAFEAKNVLVAGNQISNTGNWSVRLLGAQEVVIHANEFKGSDERIAIDASAKFHEPWLSGNVLLSENIINAEDWLSVRSEVAGLTLEGRPTDILNGWTIDKYSDLDRGEDAPKTTAAVPDAEEPADPPSVSKSEDDKPDTQMPTDAESKDAEFASTDGKDRIEGTRSDDIIDAAAGDDTVRAGNGQDVVFGGRGRDRLEGEDGDDTLFGGEDNDELRGGDGDDKLLGEDGNDRLRGGDGEDVLLGGNGSDRLDGDRGDDQLIGGAGRDELKGDKGNDMLEGGAGDDRLNGGKGADQFIFNLADGIGRDRIDDFEKGVDLLVFEGLESFTQLDSNQDGVLNAQDALVSDSGKRLQIDVSDFTGDASGSHVITLESAGLNVEDFIFM